MKNISPKLLLQKIQSNTITQRELKSLIEISYNIAYSFLKNFYKTKINFRSTNHDSIRDIAVDTIIPLFIRNNLGELGIKRSLENWDDSIQSDVDADYFLSKLIWKRADQTITNLLKERDPIFDKILKTLNMCISNNKIKKLRYFGTVYIVEEKTKILEGKLLNHESLDHFPIVLFGYKQIVLFEKLFVYIKKNTDFIPAIPLNILIKKIKEYHINKNHYLFSNKVKEDNTFIYRDIINNGLDLVKERIDTFYIPNSRLNKEDAELIMKSFSDMSKDILNGGFSGSLYDYLKFRKSSITSEQFYNDYHSIMNNLLKNFRNRISKLVE